MPLCLYAHVCEGSVCLSSHPTGPQASLGLELVSDCRLAWLGPLRISADAILGVSRQCYWMCGRSHRVDSQAWTQGSVAFPPGRLKVPLKAEEDVHMEE